MAPAPAVAPASQEVPVAAVPKLSPLKPTFSIPSSLGQTKKLGETKVEDEVPQVAEQVEEPSYTSSPAAQEVSLTQELLDQAIFSIQDVFRTANRNLELTLLDQEIKVLDGEITLQVSGSIQEDIAQKMKPEGDRLIKRWNRFLEGDDQEILGVAVALRHAFAHGKIWGAKKLQPEVLKLEDGVLAVIQTDVESRTRELGL